jgi:hypothetical protein
MPRPRATQKYLGQKNGDFSLDATLADGARASFLARDRVQAMSVRGDK